VGPRDVLAELTRRGVEVAVDGDRLRFRPQRAVTPDLRAALVEHKADLLRVLGGVEMQVRWRAEAMRSQLRPGGPIPFLVVRRDLDDTPGRCLSCGDVVAEGRRFRCTPCVSAVERVLNEIREGL
jgi:hypothetical protein